MSSVANYILMVLTQGTCHIYYDDSSFDEKVILDAKDREPVFGLQSCLSSEHWLRVRDKTVEWRVQSETFTDTAWVSREDVSD